MDKEEKKEEKVEEKKEVKEEPIESKYDYKKHSKQSMESIAMEEKKERARIREEGKKLEKELNETPEDNREDKVEEKSAEEVKKEPEKAIEPEKEKPEINVEEIAEKAAQKATDKLQADLKKVDDSKLSEQKKEERKEELRAKWTGKSQDGATVPKDYDEIIEEGRRLARLDFEEELAQREANFTRAQEEKTASEKAEKERIDALNKANEEYVSRRVLEERDRMYENNVLERPKDPNNADDPIVKRERAVFQKALEVNTQRQKENKEPITSLADIYYNYYLPSEKKTAPVGGDAPISGGGTTKTEQPSDRYDYKKDHNRSWAEIARDFVKKR